MTGLPSSQWLENTGLMWLRALDDESGFAERVESGLAIREPVRTLATQARLGYCWSRLASLFPHRVEFAGAANKSFGFTQEAFLPADTEVRVYDLSFLLLFMAWYYTATGDPAAIRRLRDGHAIVERHFDNAGVGGFGPQTAGVRSHNPYMHLLEAMLAAFQSTQDDFWLEQARRIEKLFMNRLLDGDKKVIFEFLNPDWSVAGDERVETGHQFEWSTLLLELSGSVKPEILIPVAQRLYEFASTHGFEDGLAIDAVNGEGVPIDRRKLFWAQTEAARHFSVGARVLRDDHSRSRAAEQWRLIQRHFFHANGWTWYNRLAADGTPVEEPALARLLYHVVTAAAELT